MAFIAPALLLVLVGIILMLREGGLPGTVLTPKRSVVPPVPTPRSSPAGPFAAIPLAQSTSAPGSAVTLPETRVILDAFSGLPDPNWTLPPDQDQKLRGLLEALPETACRPLDLSLGYRGFVVYLGQRPELSNEYRLRVHAGQVRWGDPWNPEAPGASCRSDTGRQVERFLLAGGQGQVPEILYKSVASEIEGAATATPAPAAERPPAVPASPTGQSPLRTAVYSDSVIGYALDYPASWQVTEIPGRIVGLESVASKLEVVPEPPGGFNTLEQLVEQLKRGGDGGVPEIVREERWQLAGGGTAVRLDRKLPSGTIAALAAVVNGRGLTLLGYSDLALFDAVARTLRPAESR